MRKSFKKGLAMVLAAAMVFSTPVAVNKSVSAAAEEESKIQTEKVAATNWWLWEDGCTSKEYSFDEEGNLKLYMLCESTPGGNAGDLMAELHEKDAAQGAGKYVSMLTNNDAWGAEDGIVDEEGTAVNGDDTKTETLISGYGKGQTGIPVGHLVEFTASLKAVEGKDYSRLEGKLVDLTDERVIFNLATNSAITDVSKALVHIVAQYGTYQVISGIDSLADAVAVSVSGGAVSLEEDGDLVFDFKVKDYQNKGIPVSVNGDITVATGSALTVGEEADGDGYVNASYTYTPAKDGKYTFAVSSTVTDEGILYTLDGEASANITLVKVGDTMYVEDKSLITEELNVAKKDNVATITWKAVDGAASKAVVTGPDKKVVKELTASGSVTVTAAGNYDVNLTVTKDGKIATAVNGFSYNPTTPGQKTDKFSKVTSATPIFKTTFDTAESAKNDGATLSAKASVKDGALVLAPDTKQKGQYYAQLPSFSTEDFSKGVTFIADVNVAAWESTWTPFVVFGDGTPASDASTATFRWAFDVGFDSLAGTKESSVSGVDDGWHTAGGAVGYYGNDASAPMATGYTYDFFSKAENQKKWFTVAVTVNKTDMTTYVNGVQIQTKKGDFTKLFNGLKKASKNYLGTSYWTGDPDLAGSMDDVAVYNTALSAADIKTLTRSDATTVTPGNGDGNVTTTAKVSKVAIKVPNKKSGKTIYMKVKDKLTLKATVTGTGSYSKKVTWKSSKTKVASVTSAGKVTAKKAGTAKITATSKTDKTKKATITIKVSKKAVKNKALKLKKTKKSLKKGKTYTIAIKKITKKTTEKITYKTSKKSVATVDAYGVVKAKKKGKANITVKCGKKKAVLKLTVTK